MSIQVVVTATPARAVALGVGGVTARMAAVLMLTLLPMSAASLAHAQVPELPLPLPTGEEPGRDPDPDPGEDPDAPPGDSDDNFGDEGVEEPDWTEPFQDDVPVFQPDADPDASQDDEFSESVTEPTAAPVERVTENARPVVTGLSPVAATLPGAFGITLAGLLAVSGLGAGILAMAKRGLFAVRSDDGGINVEATKRWRLYGGLGLLAAAGIVGVVGWAKISLETLVAAQMVYLASTGFAVLVLAVAGGSLVIAEQLRADEGRMREVEDALVNLAGQIQPLVSEPARIITKKKAAKSFDSDVTTEIG